MGCCNTCAQAAGGADGGIVSTQTWRGGLLDPQRAPAQRRPQWLSWVIAGALLYLVVK